MQEVKDLISRSTVNKAMKEKHSKWIDKLHNEHDKEIYTMAVRHMLDCVDEVEIDYTLTNAGRIRSMSDEELAMNMMCPNENGLGEIECNKDDGWIPCSERLPDAEADVLLSLRSLDIYTGFRANTEGMFYVEGEGYVEYENVLAWQPLPTPYQPKGE